MRALLLALLVLTGCPTEPAEEPAPDPQIPMAPSGLEPGWNQIDPGGLTGCSRGDDFAYFVRPGSTNRVVIDFIGGGACWNELTCSVADAIFTDTVDWLVEAVQSGEDFSGIYDASHPENPVGDWWHVIIPYCTGDIHWGNNSTLYGSGSNSFPIDHIGAVNTQAVLDWMFANFRAPEQVLVTGCSAGSYGSALWAAHVMDHWPDADVVQFGDSGAGVITEAFFQESFPSWNAEPVFPYWVQGLDPDEVDLLEKELADLYIGIADGYPDQKMSQFNTRLDSTQVNYFQYMGGGDAEAWSEQMLASVARIEAETDNFCSYTTESTQHCVLGNPNFYTMEEDGTKLVDWLQALLDGEDVSSVRCPDCVTP